MVIPPPSPGSDVGPIASLPSFTPGLTLRVRLKRDTSQIRVTSDHRVKVGPFDSHRRRTRSILTPLTVRLVKGSFLVRDGRGRSRTFSARSPLRIESTAGDLVLDGVAYPGLFTLTRRDDAESFDVIEHVGIERYLPGVLTAELYPGWSETTYEAQAIAARSYALNERQRRLALGSTFDLESTTRDQVYAGADASRRAVEAVEKTRGVVLTHQGAILRAYYSSTCGGRPASARDTWPTGRGFEFNLASPIQATPRLCPDDKSPRHRWTVHRSARNVVDRLNSFGVEHGLTLGQIRTLRSIKPLRFNAAGRPATYTITDRNGESWRLSAERLRLALNHAGSSGLDPPAKDSRVWSGDLDIRVDGGRVVINGRGFGHGVGLCQFGAEALARQGRSVEQILAFYYPGAKLAKLANLR